ncbi:hypothetical protein V2J09_023877 [Rumex salicifolius]
MELAGMLTSLMMNFVTCALLVLIYSVLRKQPSNKGVYFARMLKRMQSEPQDDPHWYHRFTPSPSWILEAWSLTEEDILEIGGVDAVVFVKILVLGLRIFSIASILCLSLLLPLDYCGKAMVDVNSNGLSLEEFTIQNIPNQSSWYFKGLKSSCRFLFILSNIVFFPHPNCFTRMWEYKDVAKMRLAHLRQSYRNPSQFTVLVRGIPLYQEETYSDSLRKFFMKYYPSSYMSHQMVYRCGKIVKLMKEAEKMYDIFSIQKNPELCSPCKFCEARGGSFMLNNGPEELEQENPSFECEVRNQTGKESGAAFVFFKNRFVAASVAQARQSTNPMLWVTSLAPEPTDVYWSNLCVPYRQFWMRKGASVVATTAFLLFFLAPVALVQSLANLNHFQKIFPFLKGLLKQPAVYELVTGYLPSFILLLFLYTVPPIMILLSTLEGSISRSGRKRAACVKVLHFSIWNVFFVNMASGTAVDSALSERVKFFTNYVLTSGWTSLAIELAQAFPIIINFLYKFILRRNCGPYDAGWTFPYHTEIPRVLLFVLLGYAFAVLAPLILPLLVVYFFLAIIVYQNQILNVYLFEYDTGGNYWPVVHNSIIFSMILAQILASGVFSVQGSACSLFSIALVVFTLVFNQFCRNRFLPIFKGIAAQELLEMDTEDEKTGREEIYKNLETAYSQRNWVSFASKTSKSSSHRTASSVLT